MGEDNGKAALGSFVPAFERVVGRTPTVDEKKEALALADVVKTSGMDPILLFYLAFRRELAEMHGLIAETRERMPGETRLGAAVEAVTEAVQLLRTEASRVVAPAVAPESVAAIGRIESRMGEIEERIGQMPTVRMLELLFVQRSSPEPSLATATRDLTVLAIAVLACIAVVVIAVDPWLRSPVLLIAAFGLGVCFSMGWLWLEPIISPVIERQRRIRR